MTATALRRNDIAYDGRETDYIAYGRIASIRNGIVTLLVARDGTLEVPAEHVRTANDYKGFSTYGPEYVIDGVTYRDETIHRMPTLRRLKQFISRREGREVWAVERRRIDRKRRRALIAMMRMDEVLESGPDLAIGLDMNDSPVRREDVARSSLTLYDLLKPRWENGRFYINGVEDDIGNYVD